MSWNPTYPTSFALSAGGWLRQPRYIRYAAQMFEAAVRLNNRFKLFFYYSTGKR